MEQFQKAEERKAQHVNKNSPTSGHTLSRGAYSPIETANPLMMQRFKTHGLQIAMGVPWRIDEPDGLQTFRLGLFGLDKMGDIPDTVAVLETALDKVLTESGHTSAASNQAA